MRKSKKRNNFYIVTGASGVGKTTCVREMVKHNSNAFGYVGYDMDAEIAKTYGKKGEGVVDYFVRAGFKTFQNKAQKIARVLFLKHENDSRTVLIDLGAGATYGSGLIKFSKNYNCILLTADPNYLWATRDKPRKTHESFDHYQMWQFDLQKRFHESCLIKVDVGFLNEHEVKMCVHEKIVGFKSLNAST